MALNQKETQDWFSVQVFTKVELLPAPIEIFFFKKKKPHFTANEGFLILQIFARSYLAEVS